MDILAARSSSRRHSQQLGLRGLIFIALILCVIAGMAWLEGFRRLPADASGSEYAASVRGLPDCTDCAHLPSDPNIFGHYAGTHCPCLEDRLVPNPRPFTLLPPTIGYGANAAQLYLELMKAVVLNTVYATDPATIDGSAHPGFATRLTMVGQRRLDNTQQLLQVIISEGIPGDFIETGTWRGGSAMFAAAVLQVYGQLGIANVDGKFPGNSLPKRQVWLADSFQGIPPVKPELYPADAVHHGAEKLSEGEENSADKVLQSFKTLGLLKDPSAVKVLSGYFNETLAEHQQDFTRRKFSLIRLDGDTYESTIQCLEGLYRHLSVGGFVVVDDYLDWYGARKATQDFRAQYNIKSPIVPVYHQNVRFQEVSKGEIPRGVWWRKESELQHGIEISL